MKLKIISMPGPEKGMKNNSAKINYIQCWSYLSSQERSRQKCVTNIETVFLNSAKPHPKNMKDPSRSDSLFGCACATILTTRAYKRPDNIRSSCLLSPPHPSKCPLYPPLPSPPPMRPFPLLETRAQMTHNKTEHIVGPLVWSLRTLVSFSFFLSWKMGHQTTTRVQSWFSHFFSPLAAKVDVQWGDQKTKKKKTPSFLSWEREESTWERWRIF